jgi:predicted Zn-dependent protease with MMP-like domain
LIAPLCVTAGAGQFSAFNPQRPAGPGAGPVSDRRRRAAGRSRRVRQHDGVEMSVARFEELVGDALDTVPPELARLMNNVVVLVEDADPDEAGLLGLYEGIALTERADYSGVLPDRITIFRLPILALCRTEEQVVREVTVTVLHEIAHHFGIDEATLHQLGWG